MNKQVKQLLIAAVALFCVSGAGTLIGALAKLQHWYWAGPVLIISISIQAASYILGGIALIMHLRKK
jgi:hypothetical protein